MRNYLLLPGVILAVACEREPRQSVYVERLGTDTLAVEVFTRSADRIEGRLVTRSPATRVTDYVADLSPEGLITRLEVKVSTPVENPDGPPVRRVVTTMQGDSALMVRQTEGEDPDTIRVAVPSGTIPIVPKTPVPVAFFEQAVREAMASGSDSFAFNLLPAGSQRISQNAIVRRGADTVAIDFFGSPMLARVNADGRILGITGRYTTMKVETELASADVDLDALVSDYAERDARGEGLGVASPGDSVRVLGGGANFAVNYSRPAKRGREIFGGLVPWETVWRTGANAATQFSTDRDLVIGGARVPAGTYTLWTTFTPETATLIINKQTGQGGTAYDESQDLVRITLESGTLAEPVERFTIVIEGRADGGVLKLMWDTSEFWVEMMVTRR